MSLYPSSINIVVVDGRRSKQSITHVGGETPRSM